MTAISCVAAPSMHAAELATRPDQARLSRVADIAMSPTGQVIGAVSDTQGQAMAGEVIEFRSADGRQWRATSDTDGHFLVRGLTGGVYQVVTNDSVSICRLWTSDTAPPSATSTMLVVADRTVVRGQPCCSSVGGTQQGVGNGLFGGALTRGLSSPWIVSGILAAGVAIPIAAANDRDDAS